MKTLAEDLLKMRIELELHLKKAVNFSEEAVIQHVIYAVGRALDILNKKVSLLQGPTNGENDDKK